MRGGHNIPETLYKPFRKPLFTTNNLGSILPGNNLFTLVGSTNMQLFLEACDFILAWSRS